MKDKIIELKQQGLSFGEISRQLGCAKSTVSYHLTDEKEKSKGRKKKMLDNNFVQKRLYELSNRQLQHATRDFQRRDKGTMMDKPKAYSFKYQDVIDKFGKNTICYLSGTPIDLIEGKNYNFDHIVPASRGGENTLENLGIVYKDFNKMKGSLTIDELIENCKKILTHHGYTIKKEN